MCLKLPDGWKDYNLYRKLWSLIGGRPWTYILRDVWHGCEFVWVVLLVSAGVWLGHHYEWRSVLTGWLIFSLGYLFGHLFWGTPYEPGQKGDE